MKKLLSLLMALCPVLCFSEYHPGAVSLKNGTVKNGFIDTEFAYNSNKITFKAGEKGTKEKIKSEDIASLYIIVKEGNTVDTLTFYSIKLANPRGLKKEYKAENETSFVQICEKGKITLLCHYFFVPRMGVAPQRSGWAYYIQKPGEDFAYHIYDTFEGPNVSVLGEFKGLKEAVTQVFKDDCPLLGESLKKEEFEQKGITYVIEVYESTCK